MGHRKFNGIVETSTPNAAAVLMPSKPTPEPMPSRSTLPNSADTANSPKSSWLNGSSERKHRSPQWKQQTITCSQQYVPLLRAWVVDSNS